MIRRCKQFSACLTLLIGLYAGSLSANSPMLEQAVKKYYAGYPAEAIGMIEPIARAGDLDAQLLLGNILYTLSQANQSYGDPLPWYHLAAEQGSAPANYALGTLYQNRWLQSRDDAVADLAQAHFHKAQELGEQKAQAALAKLAAHRRAAGKPSALTYTNDSFRSKKAPPPKAASAAQETPQSKPRREELNDVLASFQSSGDLLADAQKLQQLLSQMQGVDSANSTESTGSAPALGVLTQLLSGFESTDGLLADLVKLYDHLNTATELSTAPGAN